MANMGTSNGRDLALKAWQLFSLLLCITLFIVLMIDIWCKYTEEMTTVGVRFYSNDKQEKMLPCLTLCPWMAFKVAGFHYNNSEFNKNTFNKEELFVNLPSLDSTDFLIEEVRGIHMGRCYMVCPLKNLTLGSIQRIYTNSSLEMNVYIHNQEEKMMVAFGDTVVDITAIQIAANHDLVSAEIKIAEKRHTSLSKRDDPCGKYNNGDSFNDCTYRYFSDVLNGNCSLPGFEHFAKVTTECPDLSAAQESLNNFMSAAYIDKTNWFLHCPRPCTKTVYDAKVFKYHRNNRITSGSNDSSISFILKHETLAIEEHVETLLYDTGNFLAQMGGNLGLFLGCSCYSLLLAITAVWKH